MVGGEFAGKPVKRTGGVLWFAAEGENEIEMRIQAAVAARGGNAADRQPFARQAGSVPCLAEAGAIARLRALAKQAAERLKQNFNCELALIVVDTLAAAAGFDDENSAAETQKVMNMLAALARETQALVLLIDHYGKVIETGVRGSSAKSAANDAVLACLGDRDQATGVMSNRKMAVTKLRAGPVGRVVPFELEKTDDGSTCVVRWRPDEPELTAEKGKRWPKALIIFKRALDEAWAASARRRSRGLGHARGERPSTGKPSGQNFSACIQEIPKRRSVTPSFAVPRMPSSAASSARSTSVPTSVRLSSGRHDASNQR